MRIRKILSVMAGVVLAVALVTSGVQVPTAQSAGKPYIPLISKGF